MKTRLLLSILIAGLLIACEKEEENKNESYNQTPPFARVVGIYTILTWERLGTPQVNINKRDLQYTTFETRADSSTPWGHNIYHIYSGFPASYLCNYVTVVYVPKDKIYGDSWAAEIVHFKFQNMTKENYTKVKDALKKAYNTDSTKFYRNKLFITLNYQENNLLTIDYCIDDREIKVNSQQFSW